MSSENSVSVHFTFFAYLLLSFQFRCLAHIFHVWLLWLGLPVSGEEEEGEWAPPVLFLILHEKLSTFITKFC